MKVQLIIWIKRVSKGKNDNWLQFEAYVDCFDKNKLYIIDFCGTEADSSIPLTDKQNELFISLLVKDFGYAPFDINRAKKVIGTGKEYVITK